jgi:ankyrin repeat protein
LIAAQHNNFDRCLELLDAQRGDLRADINTKHSSTGWSSLHYATLNENQDLVFLFLQNEAEIDSCNNS